MRFRGDHGSHVTQAHAIDAPRIEGPLAAVGQHHHAGPFEPRGEQQGATNRFRQRLRRRASVDRAVPARWSGTRQLPRLLKRPMRRYRSPSASSYPSCRSILLSPAT